MDFIIAPKEFRQILINMHCYDAWLLNTQNHINKLSLYDKGRLIKDIQNHFDIKQYSIVVTKSFKFSDSKEGYFFWRRVVENLSGTRRKK